MNKGDLIKAIASKTNLPKKDIDKILVAFMESVTEAVAAGEKVTLVGFGTFEARARQDREGRNPKTGKPMAIPAGKVPAFSAGKPFKEAVNY